MNGIGLLAGAAGTLVLDTITYLDMLRSGRPSSSLPSDVVKRLAQPLGIAALTSDDDEKAPNRRSGAGALMGYGVGLGSAVVYADLRPSLGWLPWPIAGAALGLATLVISEGSATALGATDWSTWSASEWIADFVPRTAYGLTVAYVVERLSPAGSTTADARGSAYVDEIAPAPSLAGFDHVSSAPSGVPESGDAFRRREDA